MHVLGNASSSAKSIVELQASLPGVHHNKLSPKIDLALYSEY
jgi:hypothetical protein